MLLSSVIEFGIFTAALIYEVYDINRAKNELQVANNEYQQKMLNASVKGAEKERTRLSEELHDNIGSRLALLKNQLINNPVITDETQKELNNLYHNVRLLSHDLAPECLMIVGFKEYLNNYLHRYQLSTGTEVKYLTSNLPDKLNDQLSVLLFRIIQEAAHNAQKHANANCLEIQIMINEKELVLTIDDNGEGMDIRTTDIGTRGISNMEARAKTLEGRFEISSETGKGCHIMVTIPVN